MRIAYVCYWNVFKLDGVAKKIAGHVELWSRAGHDVELFCLSPAPTGPDRQVLPGQVFPFDSLLGRWRATRALATSVRDFAPTAIYLRGDTFLPPLWRAMRGLPVVMELNEQPGRNSLRSGSSLAYDLWNRRRLLRRSDAIVTVTHETARASWLRRTQLPIVVIGNGIDLGSFTVEPPHAGGPPRGVFVGIAAPWQGVDKVRQLAERLPDYRFDLIGPTAADLGGPAPANVTVHGFLQREDYEPLVATADFGIGPLAVHRRHLDESAGLKLREYAAFGLPIVVAGSDPDLTTEPHWWVLQLPNVESNVVDHLDDVRRWVEATRGRRVPREEVEGLIGSDLKERRRLDFIAETARADEALGAG